MNELTVSIPMGCLLGFVAWFLVRYLVAGIFTVNQNERAVKTSFGRAQRLGDATTAQDPISVSLTPAQPADFLLTIKPSTVLIEAKSSYVDRSLRSMVSKVRPGQAAMLRMWELLGQRSVVIFGFRAQGKGEEWYELWAGPVVGEAKVEGKRLKAEPLIASDKLENVIAEIPTYRGYRN